MLLDDEPVMFDCLEFDEGLACIDTLYDVAFLLMDLCERDLRPAAERLLTTYLELDPDDEGVALLRLFLSCRAAIRAKVHGLRAKEADGSAAEGVRTASAYLRHAQAFLEPPPPRLIAFGGLSGTGKSSLAEALAPDVGAAPGAVVLRSHRLRKRLHGVDPLERLSEGAYSAEMSNRVYRLIAERAERLLKAGHSVIADAVFAEAAHRHQLEAAAGAAGTRFDALWLDAPPDVLERRIEARRHDPSDATVTVLRRQLEFDIAGIDWPRLDARGGTDEVRSRARAALRIR